jgi:hypothetical protein
LMWPYAWRTLGATQNSGPRSGKTSRRCFFERRKGRLVKVFFDWKGGDGNQIMRSCGISWGGYEWDMSGGRLNHFQQIFWV